MLDHTQNIKDLVSIRVIAFNRTGNREGKKEFMQGKLVKTFDRATNNSGKFKETSFDLTVRANEKFIPNTWQKKVFVSKEIKHYDF